MPRTSLLFENPPQDGATSAPTAPGTLRRGLTVVVLVFLATRLVVWTAAYTGALLHVRIAFQLDPPMDKHEKRLAAAVRDPNSPESQAFLRWLADFNPLLNFDGQHYRSIIRGGYHYEPVTPETPQKDREQNIAFFPLYPLLCWPLARVLGTNAGMIVVSQVAALAAAILMYVWVRRRVDESSGRFAACCVLCWPAACYYSFGYAESVALLTVIGSLWLADRGRFWPAAILCGLATATRPTVLGLAPVLLLAHYCNERGSRARRLTLAMPLACVAVAGIGLYAAYLTYRFGSPFVYLDNFRAGWVPDRHRADWFQYLTLARIWDQFKYFGRALRELPVGLTHLTNPFTWNMPFNFFILFLSLAGLPRVPRSFRPLLLLGPFIFVHAYLASGGATFGVEPMGRYMALSAPAFVVLAAWCVREWPAAGRYALLTFMLLLQASWALRFGLDEWAS